MSSERLEAAKALLARLVAFKSVSETSNLPVIDFIEDYLAAHGVAARRAPNASGDKAALLATIGPRVDGGVVLSGHTDVVPVEGQPWSGDPFELRQKSGRLFGRGACDMKGFDACVLAMAPAFKAAALKRPVHIVLSYDEETTCLGSRDVIAWFGHDEPRPGAVIVGEPTMMQVADAHKGVATFRTRVTGHEAHSALPALGANVIAAAADVVSEIGRLAREYEKGPLDPRFNPPYSTLQSAWSRAARRATSWRANASSTGSSAGFPASRPPRRSRRCRPSSIRSRSRGSPAMSRGQRSQPRLRSTCRRSPPRRAPPPSGSR